MNGCSLGPRAPLSAALAALAVLAGCATSGGPTQVVWPAPPGPTAGHPGTASGSVRPPSGSTAPLPSTPGGNPLPGAPVPVPVQPATPVPPSYPRTAADISGPAVISLMEQAQSDRAAGRIDQALASLDRAARIEPRNAFVWSAMAKLHVELGKYDQARDLAAKSNSLARGNAYVELENWKLIAAAAEASGDAVGSLQAQTRVEDLQRTLGGG